MAQHSIWKAKFHGENTVGRTTFGPYSAFIGISGGSRKDGQNSSTGASIQAAITNNLLNIIKEMGNATLTAAPGGAVVVDSFEAASVPDCWE